MKSFKKFASTLAVITIALCFIEAKACDPTTAYGKSGKTVYDVASTIHVGADALHQLRKADTISAADEREALSDMQSVVKLNGDYASCVQSVHAGGIPTTTYIGCAQTFLNELSDPAFVSSLHIKNEKATATMQSTVRAVQTLLSSVLTQLSTMK